MEIQLNEIEVRVLGSLMEKSMTTPEYYPLSLNALTNACNQKSNRDPIFSLDEKNVVRALDSLRQKQLLVLSSSGRVPKYAEVFVATKKLVPREAALLTVLMLRGPQTLGELRARTERMYHFADLAEVEKTLDELIDSGYVSKLPRFAGRKESRYAQLLAGDVETPAETPPKPEPATLAVRAEGEKIAALESELQQLRQDYNTLKEEFEKFRGQFE